MHRVWQETLSTNANVLLPLMPDDLLTSISGLADAEGRHEPYLSPAKISVTRNKKISCMLMADATNKAMFAIKKKKIEGNVE